MQWSLSQVQSMMLKMPNDKFWTQLVRNDHMIIVAQIVQMDIVDQINTIIIVIRIAHEIHSVQMIVHRIHIQMGHKMVSNKIPIRLSQWSTK